MFDNILKFIVYLLSCNGAEIFLNLFCAAVGTELPFGTVLILWANIIGKTHCVILSSLSRTTKANLNKKYLS